ncbi:MAG: conjugal transfer protein TrbF [Arcobacter butzleri]|nr:conjugal transfer protein TrbF [Aliarcobacter butzleri]
MSKEKHINSTNPYVNAKSEWIERYGSYISQKRNWQVVAFISLIIAFTSVIFVGYMGTQNKLVPYVIEVDKLSNIQRVGMVQQNINVQNPNVIKYSLNSFIYNWRTIWGDPQTQRKFIFDGYSYLRAQTKAYNYVNEYFQKNNPYEKSKKENIRVKITSIVPQSTDTWQVEWMETISDVSENIISEDIYKGFFTVEQILPSSEEEILKNPLGVFITDINYTKVIK